jgi:hypothetical protein
MAAAVGLIERVGGKLRSLSENRKRLLTEYKELGFSLCP